MPYKEPDYEPIILQKLVAMEDFLKSFLAGLEEPFLKKGELVPVHSPASGEVTWYVGTGTDVGPGEELGYVKDKKGEIWKIRSPAVGTLIILPDATGYVGVGARIAWIKLRSTLV